MSKLVPVSPLRGDLQVLQAPDPVTGLLQLLTGTTMTAIAVENPKNSNTLFTKWQSTGNEFIERSEIHLWGKEGIQPRKYLHSIGLKDEILRKHRIGYQPKSDFSSYENWGFPNEFNQNGNPKKIWVPRGIVIPCYFGDALQSIKIRRYLTSEQKQRGEQPDHFIKGSTSALFGVENLGNVRVAIFTDDEFDAMLLEQEAGDLIGVASFGRAAKDVGAPTWASYGRCLLPIAHFVVTYTHEEETIIIIDSLPVYSRRTSRAYLPNIPNVTTLVNLRKTGTKLREWMITILHELDIPTSKPIELSALCKSEGSDESASTNDVVTPIIPDQNLDEELASKIYPAYKLVTHRFNEPWMIDPKIMPATPCYCCQYDEYRQLSDGSWVCNICHPLVE